METLDAPDVGAAFDQRRGPLAALQHALHRYPLLSPIFVLVVSWIVFAMVSPTGRFATWDTTATILKQTAVVGTIAVAQTLIVLTAGIDLAVGTGMVFTSLVIAKVFSERGTSPIVALVVGGIVGALLGAFHGAMVTRVKLPPFIVTLGTFYIFQSFGYVYSESQTIAKEPIGGEDARGLLLLPGRAAKIDTRTIFFLVIAGLALYGIVILIGHQIRRRDDAGTRLPTGKLVGVAVPIAMLLFGLFIWPGKAFRDGRLEVLLGVVFMLILYVVVSYVLNNTAWGTHVYAVGDDAEAARLAGINVNRVLFSVYVVAGLIYAYGAWVLLGRNLSAAANAAQDANLQSITAVVIGGTSLFGGRGRVWGSLIGALIVSVFSLGLKLAKVDANFQPMAIGALIIVAVALDQWIRKVAK